MVESENITVVCVLWKGNKRKFNPTNYDRPGYNDRWVQKMCNMVARNLPLEHEFVCLSNVNVRLKGGRVIPLKHNFPGWWSKLEIFRDDLPVRSGKILYIDLDAVIMSDLTPLLEYTPNEEIVMCPPFGEYKNSWKEDGKVFGYNSSVMVFKNPTTLKIWDKFLQGADHWMKKYRGDQDYLKVSFPHFPLFPSAWIRKMGTYMDGTNENIIHKIDSEVKIMLCMPVKNRVASKKHPLIDQLWR